MGGDTAQLISIPQTVKLSVYAFTVCGVVVLEVELVDVVMEFDNRVNRYSIPTPAATYKLYSGHQP